MMRIAVLLLLMMAMIGCTGAGDEPTADAQPATATTASTPATTASTNTPQPAATATETMQPTETAVPPTEEPTAEATEDTGQNPATTPVQPTPPDEPVIIFGQSGGFAGIMQTFSIYADGRIEQTENGATGQATPEQVGDLLDAIEQTGFFQLAQPKPTDNVCCDFFFYTLSVQNDASVNSVALSEGDPVMPDSFRQAVNLVQQFLSDHPAGV